MTARRADTRSTEDAIELLANGEIELLGLLPRASNYTFLAEVREGQRAVHAVYKPRTGEIPLWDFPEGTLYRREMAAHELAGALGWPSVPPTVVRDGPHGVGAVQLFVPADPSRHFFILREERLDDFEPVALFDVLINNADRKAGHCLVDEAGRIWVVDHGVCFHAEPKLRTVIWEFAGCPIREELLVAVARVEAEIRTGGLGERLRRLLSAREVDALARRAERLVRLGRFPQPGPGRSYPWPPV